ncbi:hypothetical protein [Streptomyces nodosus]|uniref:hypothetical protein n=1 Tax=Streptomyces nodosus TaxID=40318 RepID=UPI0038000169
MWNTVIGAIVAILTAILAAWVALYIAKSRRRLLWVPLSNESILRDDAVGSASVISGGVILARPRLIQLAIKNTSRHDLQRSDFTSGSDSLKFDLGTPIVAVASVTTTPSTAPTPSIGAFGSTISVGEGLIQSGQIIRISVLADGEEREVKCTAAHLLNNKLKKSKNVDSLEAFWQREAFYAAIAIFIGIPLIGFSILYFSPMRTTITNPWAYDVCKVSDKIPPKDLIATKDACQQLNKETSDSKNSPEPSKGTNQ